MDIDTLSGKNFFKLGRWVCPVLEYEMWLDWCETKEAESLNIKPESFSIVVLDGNHFHPEKSVYTQLRDKIYKEINNDNYETANKIIDSAKIVIEEINNYCETLIPNPDIYDFKNSLNLLKRIRFPWNALFAVGDAVDLILKHKAIDKNKTIDELSKYIPHLSNTLNNDQIMLYKFKQLIIKNNLAYDFESIKKKNPKLARKINLYLKQTEFIGTHHFWGDPRDINKLLRLIKDSKNIKLPKSKPAKYQKKLFETIALVTKYRLECNFTADKLQFKFRKILTEQAEKYNMNYDEIIFLTSDEIFSLNKNNSASMKIQIKKRQQAYGIFKQEKKVKVLIDDQLEYYMQKFGLNITDNNMTEIKGVIASKGKVIGKAAILLTYKENHKIQEGMILIAPETTPEFMPAMIKAAAFVTDIGGITSHAGIIARELRKPCIIGTKIATQVLKDSDLVEVDANEGIVRILERK